MADKNQGDLDRTAQNIGAGNDSGSSRERVNRDVQSEQQGESKEERIHEAYHALGEVRLGQMETGKFFSDEESKRRAEQNTGSTGDKSVHDAYLNLGEQAAREHGGKGNPDNR